MEIKIQIGENLVSDNIIGILVSKENSEIIIGEIVSYDTLTGIAICELYENNN